MRAALFLIFAFSPLSVLSTPTWVNDALSRYRRQEDSEVPPAETTPTVVDLHNEQFCVDVSTYGEVVFEASPRERCETTFAKRCETRSDQVCDEVTEMQCDIVPYTECQMTMEATPYKSYEMIPKEYKRKVCTEGMDTVKHTKMMPDCKNVTKQNCITKWEEDEDGNQVWAGNEACEPVTWRECKLIPRQVDFKVPKINCEEGEAIPYTDLVDAEKTQMTTKMSCEVKHTTNCEPVTSTKCQNIQYQECSEEPVEQCEQHDMMVPTQEKEHKKKCLLPDDGSLGSGNTGAGNTPNPAPRGSRTLSVQGRGANGQLRLPVERLPSVNNRQTVQRTVQQQPTVNVLPLDRFEEAASTRQARTFTGRVGRPRFVSHQQQIVQPVQHRRIQGQFIAN